jgi:ABC-2 type transport system ATP-binding protein
MTKEPVAGAPPTIEATGLARSFGAVEALRGVDLRVAGGELYGLVGPDGAGKTTTMRLLAGLLRPSRGELRVRGERPLGGGAVREQLGLMPQEFSLYRDLSIAENLRFFGRLFALPRAVFEERRARLLGITRLARFEDRPAGKLSGGMYKKLALACALLHEPRVLLLDEPTNGVDPVSRQELWELVYEFVDQGMTVVVTTSYMDEAERCHRVGLMHDGILLAEGAPAALVAGLDEEAWEVDAADRRAVHRVLDAAPYVVAASPAGERLAVLVAPGGGERLRSDLAGLDAALRPARPTFEDLFLARVAAGSARGRAPAPGRGGPGEAA